MEPQRKEFQDTHRGHWPMSGAAPKKLTRICRHLGSEMDSPPRGIRTLAESNKTLQVKTPIRRCFPRHEVAFGTIAGGPQKRVPAAPRMPLRRLLWLVYGLNASLAEARRAGKTRGR